VISLQWLLTAKGASIERETSAMTIFNTISGFRADGFPLFLPQVAVAALVRRKNRSSDQKSTLTLEITLNKDMLFKGDIAIDFQDKLNNHLCINIQGMVIPAPGEVVFTLRRKKKELGSFSFLAEGPAAKAVAAIQPAATGSARNASASPAKKKKSRKAK
jgi:hypothetical protein